MELRQLRYFFAACDYGSLATAARHLGTVPSNMSMQISRLERELGVRLCERTSAGLRPTSAGEHLYRVGGRVAHEFDFFSRYAVYHHQAEAQTVAVATPVLPRGSILAEALSAGVQAVAERLANVNLRLTDLALPVTSEDEISAALDPVEDGDYSSALATVFDRWVLISRHAEPQTDGHEFSPDRVVRRLYGFKTIIPKMPLGLVRLAERFAHSLGVEPLETGLAADLASREVLLAPGQAVLMPLSCVPGSWRLPRIHILPTAPSDLDPAWRLQKIGHSASEVCRCFSEGFVTAFGAHMRTVGETEALSAAPRTARTEPRISADARLIQMKEAQFFDAAFECGNISRAAEQLRVSQPAVSTCLQKLEQKLGYSLFWRTAHGIVPTERGMSLRRLSRPVLQDIADLRRRLRELAKSRPTSVKIGMVPALDLDSLLAEAMAFSILNWSEAFREGEVRIVEGFNARLRRWTVQGEIDLAIVDSNARQAGLTVIPLLEDDMVVVTAPGSGLLASGPVPGCVVIGLKLALPSVRHGLREVIDRRFQDFGLKIDPALEIDSMAAALRLVKYGDWATILPVSAVHAHASAGHLQLNRIVKPQIMRHLSVVRRVEQPLDQRLAEFITLFSGRLNETATGAGITQPAEV